MEGKTFTAIFSSDVNKVKKIVADALVFLEGVFPDMLPEMYTDLKLLMNEALLNAVTHGNNIDESKNVAISIKAYDECAIKIRIEDCGDGFDFYAALDEVECEDALLRETGRGIRIVKALSDEISYNKKGNILKIYKKVVTNG